MNGIRTPEEAREWIRGLMSQSARQHADKIAAATPGQIIAMLHDIINRGEPDTWDEQQVKDMSALGFVADWIGYVSSTLDDIAKRAPGGHEHQLMAGSILRWCTVCSFIEIADSEEGKHE